MTQTEDKYCLSKITKEVYGEKVYQIVALKAIPAYNVKVGEAGGYVAGYNNLSQLGDCWINHEAVVMENASVTMDAYVSEKAEVLGQSVIKEKARVEGNAHVKGNSVISRRAIISGQARVISTRVSTDCRITEGALVENSAIGGNALIYGDAYLVNSNISGLIEIGNSVIIDRCTVRGKRIEIRDSAKVVDSKIGSHFSKSIEISNFANIQGAKVKGKGVLIHENAIIRDGVSINGELTSISGNAEMEGSVEVGSDVTIMECVQIINKTIETWEFEKETLNGDLLLTNNPY